MAVGEDPTGFIPVQGESPVGFVPIELPVRPRQRPTYSLGGLAGQFASGAAMAVPDATLGLTGVLGVESAANAHRRVNDAVNEFMGVEDPRWREDLPGFIAREVGSAVVGLPARALGGAYNLISNAPTAVRAGARALEAITPLTLPLTGRNIAINAGVGGLAGAGIQELQNVEEAAQEVQRQRQYDDAARRARFTGPNAPAIPSPTPVGVSPEGFQPITTGEDPTGFQLITAPEPLTLAGRVLPILLPGAALAGLGGAGYVGVRAWQAERANRAAQVAGNVTQPGPDPNSLVLDPTITQRLVQAGVSDATMFNAHVDRQLEAGTITPAQAAEQRSAGSRIFPEAPRYDQISEAFDTGNLPITGTRFRNQREFEIPLATLRANDPVRFQNFVDALNIGTELDNRAENLANNSYSVYNGVRSPTRVNLWHRDDVDLQNTYNRYAADPVVAGHIAAYRQDMDNLLDYMLSLGLKDAQAIQAMRQVNPHYVFTQYARDRLNLDQRGSISRTQESNTPLTERTRSEMAGGQLMQDPLIARNEAWRKVMDAGMTNDAIRRLAENSEVFNRTLGPNERRLVGRIIAPQAPARDGFADIAFTDRNGTPFKLEVTAELADLLRATPRASVPVLSGAAGVVRNATTGPIGALMGSVMAFVSAGMASGAVALNRPKGARAGLFDGAVQSITGGRTGIKGDPTFILQTAGQFVRDMTAQSSKWIYNAVERSHLNNGPLARTLGQQGTLDVLRKMDNYYSNSTLAAMRRTGATGTGLSYDPATRYALNPGLQANTPELRRAAVLQNNIRSIDDAANYVRQLGGKVLPIPLQRAWDMYKQTLDIASGAATSAYYRLNRGQRGLSDTALAGEARTLSGDPSAMGSNKIWQGTLSILPYSNITIQSAAQYTRALKASPQSFIPGLVLAATVPPLLEVASALYADHVEIAAGRPPKYMARLLMQNAQQTTGDIRISIPGVEPADGMRITPDQPIMPFIALTRALIIRELGADSPAFWTPEMAPLREGFVDLMSDATKSSFYSALSTAFTSFNMNPLIGAAVEATTGTNVDNLLNLSNPRIQAPPRDVGMPGYEDRRGSNDPVPRAVEAILKNVAGASADAILGVVRTGVIASLAEDGGRPLTAAAEQYGMIQEGNLRQVAPLFQQPRRLTQRDVVGEVLAPKETRMMEITQGYADRTRPGTVGSGRSIQDPLGVGRQEPPADIAPILDEAKATYSNRAMARIRELRTAAQQQILSIENDPKYANDPQRRLRDINTQVQQIRALNRDTYEQVQALEARLSIQTGRRIKLERLDPQRGLDQFPALQ